MTKEQAYRQARKSCIVEGEPLPKWERHCRKLTVFGGPRPRKVAAYLIEDTDERHRWMHAMSCVEQDVADMIEAAR